MDRKQLETRYIEVKSDIKANMTMIKMYADSIQQCREKLESLSAELSALQSEYAELTKKEKENNEQIDSNAKEPKQEPQ